LSVPNAVSGPQELLINEIDAISTLDLSGNLIEHFLIVGSRLFECILIEKLRMKFPEARIAQRRHDDVIRNSGGVHIAERLGSPGQSRGLHPPLRGSQSQVLISYFQTNLVQVATFSINGSTDSRNSIGEVSERVSAL